MSGGNSQVKQPASFAFTPENMEKAKVFISRYPAGRQKSALMPLLDLAQRQEGWVSLPAMDYIAEMLDVPPMQAYEVATFYTMYRLKPMGRHHIEVCTTTPCQLRGSDGILHTCQKVLGIGVGETTADGMFSLVEAECLAACVNAPMIQIGDDYYEDLDEASMTRIIETLRAGGTPTPGPQNGRITSAPLGGPTTLKDIPGKEG